MLEERHAPDLAAPPAVAVADPLGPGAPCAPLAAAGWTLTPSGAGWSLASLVPRFQAQLAAPELNYYRWPADQGRPAQELQRLPALGRGEGAPGGAWLSLRGEDRALQLELELRPEPPQAGEPGGVLVCGRVLHLGQAGEPAVALQRVTLELTELQLGAAGRRHACYKNGYQSWSESRAFAPAERERLPWLPFARRMQDDVRNLPVGEPGVFTSSLFTVLGNLDDHAYLLAGQVGGFAQAVVQVARFDPAAGRPRSLRLAWDFGGAQLRPGAAQELDPLLLLVDDEPCRLQRRWLARLPQPATPPRPAPPAGWCSWYCHGTHVRQDDVLQALAVAAAHPGELGLIQLDDGYATAVGDWLSLRRTFSRGLGHLAGQIREAGQLPGLWLAPFLAQRGSRLARDHGDWLLRDARGQPVDAGYNPLWGLGARLYALDTTHPGFQDYLRRVVRTMAQEWGFGLLKLDFLFAAALPGLAHDPTLTPAQRLSLGYRLIRQAAGPETFLLGCGAPLAPSIGLVDGMRIGPDVAPFWFPTLRYHLTHDPHALSARFAIRSTLHRAPLHDRVWHNDPDVLLLRQEQTRLTDGERLSLATAVAITGGLVLDSDWLDRLPQQAWTTLAEVRRVAAACAAGQTLALDYLEQETATLVFNSAGFLAVFNFGDRPATRVVEHRRWLAGRWPLDVRLRSVWDGRELRLVDGRLELGLLPPHSAVLLERL